MRKWILAPALAILSRTTGLRVALLATALAVLAGAANAGEEPATNVSTSTETSSDWLTRDTLTGDWDGSLVPGRNQDNWGVGYYYDSFSQDLKDALAPAQTLRNEQAIEIFYNFVVTPWCVLGFDLQMIKPALASATAVFPGVRAVITL